MLILFAKRASYSAISGFSFVFSSLISGIIVARILGVEETGRVAFAVWLAFILSQVVDGGTSVSVGRFVAELRGKRDEAGAHALSGRLSRALLFYNLLAIALCAAAFVIAPSATAASIRHLFGNDGSSAIALATTVLLLLVAQSFAAFAAGHFRGTQNFGGFAVFSFASMAAQIVCVTAGSLLFQAPGAIAGYAIGQGMIALPALGLLFARGRVSTDLARQARHYGGFSWGANLFNAIVWSRIELLFLQSFWGYREVGLFSVALALSAIASQGPLLLTGAFLPMLAEKHGRRDREGLQLAFASGTRFLALVAFPACFGMAAIVPSLIGLLYAPSFAPATDATMIISTAAAFSVSTTIGSHLINALGRSDLMFVSSLIGAILSIGTGFLLIPEYGLLGAALARTVTQFTIIAWFIWFVTPKLGFAYPFRSLVLTLGAAIVSALAAHCVITIDSGVGGLVLAIPTAAVVYLLSLRLFGAVEPQDLLLAHRVISALPPAVGTIAKTILSFVERDERRPTATPSP